MKKRMERNEVLKYKQIKYLRSIKELIIKKHVM